MLILWMRWAKRSKWFARNKAHRCLIKDIVVVQPFDCALDICNSSLHEKGRKACLRKSICTEPALQLKSPKPRRISMLKAVEYVSGQTGFLSMRGLPSNSSSACKNAGFQYSISALKKWLPVLASLITSKGLLPCSGLAGLVQGPHLIHTIFS